MIQVLTNVIATKGNSAPQRVFLALRISDGELERARRNYEFETDGEPAGDDFWKTTATENATATLQKWGWDVTTAEPDKCRTESAEKFAEITLKAESLHKSMDGSLTVWLYDVRPA